MAIAMVFSSQLLINLFRIFEHPLVKHACSRCECPELDFLFYFSIPFVKSPSRGF